MKRQYVALAILSLMILVLSSCNLGTSSDSESPSPTAVPAEIATDVPPDVPTDVPTEAPMTTELGDCIIGSWVQDTAEIESHLRATLPPSFILESLTGQLWYIVDADGSTTFFPQDYAGAILMGEGEPPLEISVTGVATSTYTLPADASGTITVTPGSTNFVIIASVGGSSIPIPLESDAFVGGPFFDGGTFQYECTDTTLTVFIPDGVAPFDQSTFMRASEAPPVPSSP